MPDLIKKISLKDGSVRYRFVVDIGPDAAGKRQQKRLTFSKINEARAELARIRHEVGTGVFVAPGRTTLAELLDTYLAHVSRDIEAGTAEKYRAVLLPVRDRLGERPVQELREEHIDALVDWMLTSARRRGGQPGSGLSATTVSLALGQLRAALNIAVRRQLVVRNVALDTRIPREARRAAAAKRAELTPWTADEARTFLQAIATDRLYAPILLLCMGLRPAEVCGMPWSDADLATKPGTVRVATTRTIVAGQAVEKVTKTAAGTRTLQLPSTVADAMREFKARQAAEGLAVGAVYSTPGHVLVDELGRPFKTDQLRRWLYKLMRQAGVRQVRPYDARHTCLTYLATSDGVPDVTVSGWAGHTDPGFTKRRYVHPDGSHLALAAERLDLLFRQAPEV